MGVDALLIQEAESRLRAELESLADDAELLRARINGTRRVLDEAGGPTVFVQGDYLRWERGLQQLDEAIRAAAHYGNAFLGTQLERVDKAWHGLRDLHDEMSQVSGPDELSISRREALEHLMTVAVDAISHHLVRIAERLEPPLAEGARAIQAHVAQAYRELSAPGREAQTASLTWTAQGAGRTTTSDGHTAAGRDQLTAAERQVDNLAWFIGAAHGRYAGSSTHDRLQAQAILARRSSKERPPPPPPPASRPPSSVRR
jgi:hypothetical protein